MPYQDMYFGNRDLRSSFENTGRRGESASDAYLKQALSYNPVAALRSANTGSINQFRRQFGLDLGELRGSQVGSGRLNTGWGYGDQDRLFTESADRLNDKFLSNAFNAENLRMQNMSGLANFGAQQGSEYRGGTADLGASFRDYRDMQKQRSRDLAGNIFGGFLTGAGYALSDETLKEDIEDAPAVLPRLRKLKGKRWRWNQEGRRLTGEDRQRSGVIAQEVETEFPELVERDRRTGKKRVDYGGLAATLVNALGELDAKVERMGGSAAAALAGA